MDVLKRHSWSAVLLALIFSAMVSKAGDLSRLPFVQKTFGDCQLEKENVFLKGELLQKVKQELSSKPDSKIIRTFKLKNCSGPKSGRLYFLSDVVRTHYQTLLFHIQDHEIQRLKLLEFNEPQKYAPPENWQKQFSQKEEVRNVDALTGATLTESSFKKLGRLVLIIDQAIGQRQEGRP